MLKVWRLILIVALITPVSFGAAQETAQPRYAVSFRVP